MYTTTSAVTLNGITFPDFGQTFTITLPDAQDPGGHFSAPGSVIRVGSVKVFSGDIDWSLPAGSQGDEQALKTFSVASGAQLFGLSLAGSVSLNLGWDAGAKYYATFGLNIQLPAGFSAGPDPSFGSVTGAASLRVDDAGVHYNGVQVEAENVWIGKLKVDQVCFSYIPAGGQTDQPVRRARRSTAPRFITCATDVDHEPLERQRGDRAARQRRHRWPRSADWRTGRSPSSAGSSTTSAAKRRSRRTST